MMSTNQVTGAGEHRPVLSVFISTVSLKADKIMIGTCIFIVIRKTDKFVSSMVLVRRVERLT